MDPERTVIQPTPARRGLPFRPYLHARISRITVVEQLPQTIIIIVIIIIAITITTNHNDNTNTNANTNTTYLASWV